MDCIQNKKNSEKVILTWLKEHLDEQRLLHSLGCAACAKELAKRFHLDEEKAYLAGLLHDCAKCFEKENMVKIAKGLDLDEEELHSYKVLHAPVSAYIAKKEFGVEDKDVLSAIRWHTLGHLQMSKFEKLIFLADKIEPNTRDADFREKALRILDEEHGLDKAILLCYKETIASLIRRDFKISYSTIDIYNTLLKH